MLCLSPGGRPWATGPNLAAALIRAARVGKRCFDTLVNARGTTVSLRDVAGNYCMPASTTAERALSLPDLSMAVTV
jgi:hypothetical protein